MNEKFRKEIETKENIRKPKQANITTILADDRDDRGADNSTKWRQQPVTADNSFLLFLSLSSSHVLPCGEPNQATLYFTGRLLAGLH